MTGLTSSSISHLIGFQGQLYILGTNIDNKRLAELRIPNPNVTWEVAEQTNIGFEAQFLNRKLTVEADSSSIKGLIFSYFRNGCFCSGINRFNAAARTLWQSKQQQEFELTVGYGDRSVRFQV